MILEKEFLLQDRAVKTKATHNKLKPERFIKGGKIKLFWGVLGKNRSKQGNKVSRRGLLFLSGQT
jgi:hypothetical protein